MNGALPGDAEPRLAVLEDRRGLEALRAVALDLLPVTPDSRAGWSARLPQWEQALTDEELRRGQRQRLVEWRELLRTLIAQGVDDGELPAVDDAAVAMSLAAMLDGLGLHALLDPELITPDVMRQQIEVFLAAISA